MAQDTRASTLSGTALIKGPFLILQPELVAAIGFYEALMLQLVHFRLQASKNMRDGRRWVYNSYPEWWREIQPIMSEVKTRLALRELEKQGLLSSGQYGRAGDQRKWYTINYEYLHQFLAEQGVEANFSVNKDADRGALLALDDALCEVTATPEASLGKTRNAGEHDPDSLKLLKAYEDWLGYKAVDRSAESKSADALLKDGWSIDQIEACYRHFKAQAFWSTQHLSLKKVRENIAPWEVAKSNREHHESYEPEGLALEWG